MTAGMLLAFLATMLIPLLAREHVSLVIACRVLVGMGTVRISQTYPEGYEQCVENNRDGFVFKSYKIRTSIFDSLKEVNSKKKLVL